MDSYRIMTSSADSSARDLIELTLEERKYDDDLFEGKAFFQ